MKTRRSQFVAQTRRGGFTLVELLVSVGLVILTMSMFTVVFQMASGTISTQRGIATNDQRVRTLTTVLKADLKYRTYKSVIPYAKGETDTGTGDVNFALREGYIYFSENDPDIDTDDVLQFTIAVPISQDPIYGRAVPLNIPETAATWQSNHAYLIGDWVQPTSPNGLVYVCERDGDSSLVEPSWGTSNNGVTTEDPPPAPPVKWRGYFSRPQRNQPEWDDGQGGNDTGTSYAAEVAYFVRNGILYRRVLLLRQPLTQTDPVQPTDDRNNQDFFDPNFNPPYAGAFWADFDYSAHYNNNRAVFHGYVPLQNDLNNGAGSGISPLGRPRYRFGFNPADNQPKEYLDANNPVDFMGRYTLEECSHTEFGYPQRTDGASGNPMARAIGLTLNSRGIANQYDGGPRRGEDALLFNVHRFDVELYDEGTGNFQDLGHNIVGGDFYQDSGDLANNKNSHLATGDVYGPTEDPETNRVFDTWHPEFDLHGTSDTTANDEPPFRPLDSSSNPRRVKALRIQIQFLDPASSQIRQVTLVHNLLDNVASPRIE